jgi:hypothetical protein
LFTHTALFINNKNKKGKVKTSYLHNRPWRPIGLWDVETPTFCLDSRLTDTSKVISLKAPAALDPPGRFLVLISVRGYSVAGMIR